MPKYEVLVTADATVSTVVDVEAASPEEAIEKALSEAEDEPGAFDWRLDDNTPTNVYVGDAANAAELVEG